MPSKESPHDVEVRATVLIKTTIAKYGLPPAAEVFLLNTYPVMAREMQAMYLSGTNPVTARSSGLILAFQILCETIEATTPPGSQNEIFRASIVQYLMDWKKLKDTNPLIPEPTNQPPVLKQ